MEVAQNLSVKGRFTKTMWRRTLGATDLFTTTLVAGALLVLVLVLVTGFLGIKPLAVQSGSMAPTFNRGDLVITDATTASEAKVGQIITFRDPNGARRLITHRLAEKVQHSDGLKMVTKGDANKVSESWKVDPGGSVGVVKLDLPKLGYVLIWANTPLVRALLVAASGLLITVLVLKKIWQK